MLVWHDPVARVGPENMALDEALLDNLGERPVLRVYGWRTTGLASGTFNALPRPAACFRRARFNLSAA